MARKRGRAAGGGAAAPWRSVALPADVVESGGGDQGGVFMLEEIPAGTYQVVDGRLVFDGVPQGDGGDDGDGGSDSGGDTPAPAPPAAQKKAKGKRAAGKAKAAEAPADSDGEEADDQGKDEAAEQAKSGKAMTKDEKAKAKAEKAKAKAQARAEAKARAKQERAEALSTAKAEAKANMKALKESFNSDSVAEWLEFGLHNDLLHGLSLLGFSSPTAVQRMSLPKALRAGMDILGAAETGSGKTLAFGLPILNGLLEKPPVRGEGLAALILTPTRELANQVSKHLMEVSRVVTDENGKPRIRIGTIVGGMALVKQERVLSSQPDIIVATPGRLWALIANHNEHLANLATSLRYLAVDEADRMFEKGHFPDLQPFVDLLEKGKAGPQTHSRQTFLFSATLILGMEHAEASEALAQARFKAKKAKANKGKGRGGGKNKKGANDEDDGGPKHPLVHLMSRIGVRGKPAICDVATRTESAKASAEAEVDEATASSVAESAPAAEASLVTLPETLTLTSVQCTDKTKTDYLYYFLTQYYGRCLVFVNTISVLRRVTEMLRLLKVPNVTALHANMQQRQRLRNLDQFAKESRCVMVATDVAARGLDIRGVDFVIQYNIPRHTDSFVHRAGRTARAQQRGLCLALVGPSELGSFTTIAKEIGQSRFEEFPIGMTYLPMIKSRVAVARRIEVVERKMNAKRAEKDWFLQQAQAADLELDDYVTNMHSGSYKKKKSRAEMSVAEKEMQALHAQLNQMLQSKITPHFLSGKYVATGDDDKFRERLLTGKKRDALEDAATLAGVAKSKRQRVVMQ